jgi:hypothetical protein
MSKTLRLRDDAADWRTVDDEVVVLVRSTSTYIAVNHTGAVIWPAIADGTSRDDLIALLVDAFDIDAGTAARDVDAFVAALAEQDLLEGQPLGLTG